MTNPKYDSLQNCAERRGHRPVMLKEAVEILSPKDGLEYLDCTFGGGGHTRAILESADCRVTAVDRDPSAVARAIKSAAESGGLKTTLDLAKAVESALPRQNREKIHPATRAFQALRIAVNDELGEISRALPDAFGLLSRGGVLAAISFHSLEDRIVKRFFKKLAGLPEDRRDRSFAQDRVKLATLLTRKPAVPSEAETAENPRSRSAKLRAIRKD